MNTVKIQRELFNAMIGRNQRPCVGDFYGNQVFTATGYCAYFLRPSDLVLDIDKFRKGAVTQMPEYDEEKDVPLKITRAAYVDHNGTVFRRFDGGAFVVYINLALLKAFDNPSLLGRSAEDRVLVFEKDQLVGIVMPGRIAGENSDLAGAVLSEVSE